MKLQLRLSLVWLLSLTLLSLVAARLGSAREQLARVEGRQQILSGQEAVHFLKENGLYERVAGGLTSAGQVYGESAKLTAGDGGAGDNFGLSVAVDGDTAVVGAYVADGGGNADQGAAYVFVRSDGGWTQQQKLTASDGAGGDNFGWSVAVDGDTAVIGASRADVGGNAEQGAAYVFVRSGGSWTQQQKLTAGDGAATDWFGLSVAVAGDTAVVGAPNAHFHTGVTYVYVRSGSSWTEQQKLTVADRPSGEFFGSSVALDGDTAVVGFRFANIEGISNQGAAYVFVRSGGSWTQQQQLTAGDGAAADLFGGSVAVAGDTAVVGASNADVGGIDDQGAAYVFVRSGGSWTEQQKLTAGDGADNDFFGSSAAVNGDTVVVGARGAAVGESAFQGAAYVYVRSGGSWTEQQKLTASDGAASDQFGRSVALDGDTAVVGAGYADVGGNDDQGAAYVFEPPLTVYLPLLFKPAAGN